MGDLDLSFDGDLDLFGSGTIGRRYRMVGLPGLLAEDSFNSGEGVGIGTPEEAFGSAGAFLSFIL